MHNEWMKDIDPGWTLFLDRDGVINIEKEGDYIRNVSEFRFIEHALDAFSIFKGQFNRIFVVTNQKGVGKGLMTQKDLDQIHRHMLECIKKSGGHIDKIYSCTALEDNDPHRKPNPGMAFEAQRDYPEVNFSKSLMIGNTMSDMKFGKSVGMRTIFIPSAKPLVAMPDPLVDEVMPNLLSVAKALQNTSNRH